MVEAIPGVFLTRHSPKHCPGCGQRLAYNGKPAPANHVRIKANRDWMIVCPAAPTAAAAAAKDLKFVGHNYHVRSGLERGHARPVDAKTSESIEQAPEPVLATSR
jgi:hypothetical protein